ncbi:Paired amphipathic helix protein pst1 [Vanrija pseudolonga]|uniref:Paired amphipathic helix protein pst1 n=1 Tax=Vanrija pseudolonga TaxID=143232 RepID=A0AAF0YBI5_9TREE|nr:Paired amphipathic helix protein pst1 [Vanrija pseudolonga]
MSNPPQSGSGGGNWSNRDPGYRPLNVRDALSYLDQVKIQFADQPEVYNRFLDVMKEFKGQVIDTPGVIDRVSTLFRGHPSLIQGFNTFLPPGYRIECYGPEGDPQGMITVTTPTGTVSQVPGGLAAAIDQRERESQREQALASEPPASAAPYSQPPPPAPYPAQRAAPPAPAQSAQPPARAAAPPPNVNMPPQHPAAPSGPSTPGAAQFLASGGLGHQGQQPQSQQQAGGARAPILEFNHAISFVNKIKNRFNSEPETYKNFLEILQTYQRDQKIEEVYEQVIDLFKHAPDLLAEFKQFLPESGGFGLGNFMQAASSTQTQTAGQKRKDAKEPAQAKKRRAGPDGKAAQQKKKADSPVEEEAAATTTTPPQTLASPDEVAFFDKVKKFIDDKVTYHEFLKLINLFTQDMIDAKILLERAKEFIGDSGEVWTTFKRIVGIDDLGSVGRATTAQSGYGFGGMINIDNQTSENTPMLERVKPDLSGPKVKTSGPSYRKLPQSEINLNCTGRDAMCWEVLNDEWVSHPTWAAEDAAPFLAHRKNAYEEALHKSEEERHEYDFHIEANLRTIALLEPLNNKIQTMDPEERAHFNLKAGLGGHSRSIYQRIIKKVYGKELGPDIIRALHENPVTALPIVLDRLKAKDEEWKKAQREWNRVWREQDAKNFYKALDHQGVVFKAADKKTLAAKSLIAEIEARRREQANARNALLRPRNSPRARFQFQFEFKDVEVLKDSLKLIFGYLDRVPNMNAQDKERIETQIREFVPLFFMFDKDAFDAEFGDAEHGSDESDGDSDGDASMAGDDDDSSAAAKKKKAEPSLRKQLLKAAGDKDGLKQRESTSTPGPEDGVDSALDTPDRAETPIPTPADPAAVAEAVAKDKVDAEASEQTWVQLDTSDESAASDAPDVPAPKPTRAGNFFANNHYYVFIRLLQILYSRLVLCKTIAAQLAAERKQPINPVAIRLGLAEPATANFGIEAGENPSVHYYDHLLALAERLFDNDLDPPTYEETLRLMFGNKAYTMFTIDRVVSAICKQAQTILGDMKSQELLSLLQRDRAPEKTTTRQQIAYRMNAEGVLGPDENLYRIEYIPRTETVAVQLLAREDLTMDDPETAEQKWRQYIDSYALTHPTEGLPHRVEQPFLNRTLGELPDELGPELFETHSGLQFRVASGNYHLFYQPGTEDYFHRARPQAEEDELDAQENRFFDAAKKRLEDWINKPAEGDEDEAQDAAVDAEPAAASEAADGTSTAAPVAAAAE